MTPYLVYKLYLALKLHFTTDKYDIIKMKGRVRASEESFARRNDLMGIRRLARKYNVKECTNFMVANFVKGDKGGGMFTIGSETIYKEWVSKMESLSYVYKSELEELLTSRGPADLWNCAKGHPPILKAYLNGSASLETLVILNKLFTFVPLLDTYLTNDVIWPDVKRLIVKYSPFVQIDKHKYKTITERVIQH